MYVVVMEQLEDGESSLAVLKELLSRVSEQEKLIEEILSRARAEAQSIEAETAKELVLRKEKHSDELKRFRNEQILVHRSEIDKKVSEKLSQASMKAREYSTASLTEDEIAELAVSLLKQYL